MKALVKFLLVWLSCYTLINTINLIIKSERLMTMESYKSKVRINYNYKKYCKS